MDDVQNNLLYQMKKLAKAMLKANEMLNKSVVYYRKEVLEEGVITLADNPTTSLVLFGVKNTEQINIELVKKLQQETGFLFHTVDKMSERGRAVDVDLINPLTGRVMTGSSSGSCINILKGINDVAICTDGGGSVLAPAMSTGLFSIMGKGVGLKGNKVRISTDNIEFVPGIGVISYDYDLCIKVIKSLCDIGKIDSNSLKKDKLKVAIPEKDSVILPDGTDMRNSLEKVINKLDNQVEFIDKDFCNIENRHSAITFCRELFNSNIDIIITAEGPIDLFGIGDSVLGSHGEIGSKIQNSSGKYLLKVANMLDATAVSIPTGNLGISILIIGKKGIDIGEKVIKLGKIIKELYPKPKLFKSYFIEGYEQENYGFF